MLIIDIILYSRYSYLCILAKIMKNILFLDRDWVINVWAEKWEYIMTTNDFKLTEGIIRIIKDINTLGVSIFVVTNQQCVWKWLMSESELDMLHNYMKDELSRQGVYIEWIMTCPHVISDDCECRKPKPGMILDILKRFPDIDPRKCLFVWDSDTDIEAWVAAWVETLLIEKNKIGEHYSKIMWFYTTE